MADQPNNVSILSRLQWSKRGITAYGPEGQFEFRLEHPWAVNCMNQHIISALIEIDREKKKHRANAAPEDDAGRHAGSVPDDHPGTREVAVEPEEAIAGIPV